MSEKITRMSEYSEDNRMWSLSDMMRDCASEMEKVDNHYNRAIVILVRSDESTFDCGYRAANISCSQALAALKITERLLLRRDGALRVYNARR